LVYDHQDETTDENAITQLVMNW